MFDAASNRLFLVEGEFADPLIEVRPNGDRVVIRNASLGTGTNFRSPAGIKYDAARHVLMAADYIGDVIAEIDPATGHRTIISGRSDGRGSIDTDPIDVAFAPGSKEHYIVDFQTKTLYAVAAGGATRIVTSPATGSGPPLLSPRRVEVDEAGHIVYALDDQAVIAVNLENGARQTILSGFGPPAGMALDLPSRRLFVSNILGPILEIDLATGAHRTVSSGGAFGVGGGLAYDNVNARLLSIDQASFRLESIDVGTGVRTELMGADSGPCARTASPSTRNDRSPSSPKMRTTPSSRSICSRGIDSSLQNSCRAGARGNSPGIQHGTSILQPCLASTPACPGSAGCVGSQPWPPSR